MAARKRARRASKPKTTPKKETTTSWRDYFHFNESYSSLLLGIVVVIVTTIILVFIVKDRNNNQPNLQKEVSSTKTERIAENITPTASISGEPEESVNLSVEPTKLIIPSDTPVPTNIIAQKQESSITLNGKAKVHTVSLGENLWVIAEKYYKSGYNWVDIAKVNNLSNPGIINNGQKLVIPNVTPKLATIVTEKNNINTSFGPKITSSTYKVQKGDHLWGIAVRAYGDGFKWTEIAKVNNIANPSIIEPGQVIKLPQSNSLGKK